MRCSPRSRLRPDRGRALFSGLALLVLVALPAAGKTPGGQEGPSVLSIFVELCLGALADREAVPDRIVRRFGSAATPDALPRTPPGIRATGAWRLAAERPLLVHLAEPGGQCIVIGEVASATAFLSEVEGMFGQLPSRLPGFVRLGPPERSEAGPGRSMLRSGFLEAGAAGHPPRVLRVLASAGGGAAVISAETEEAAPLRR
ncbi:MAG: hypothetical protein ACK4PG_01890 [Acetobacteraceae bacterium]